MRRRQQRLFGEVVTVKCALLSVPTGVLGDNSWVQLVPVGRRVHVTQSPCSFTLIASQEGGGGAGPEMTALVSLNGDLGKAAWPRGWGWPLRYPQLLWPQSSRGGISGSCVCIIFLLLLDRGPPKGKVLPDDRAGPRWTAAQGLLHGCSFTSEEVEATSQGEPGWE